MRIAFVSLPGKGATDACLAEAVALLTARGVPMAGTVQTNPERPGTHVCDMDVRVLPDGPVLRISQNLGAGARGCRLDGGALTLEGRLPGAVARGCGLTAEELIAKVG